MLLSQFCLLVWIKSSTLFLNVVSPGLADPVLHLNTAAINEGEELTANCTAPGEEGSFSFFFFQNNKQVGRVSANSNKATTIISLRGTGTHRVHCSYKVRTTDEFVSSAKSPNSTVLVKGK